MSFQFMTAGTLSSAQNTSWLGRDETGVCKSEMSYIFSSLQNQWALNRMSENSITFMEISNKITKQLLVLKTTYTNQNKGS